MLALNYHRLKFFYLMFGSVTREVESLCEKVGEVCEYEHQRHFERGVLIPDLRFGVEGFRLRVWGLNFDVCGLELRVLGSGSGLRV